MNELKCKVYDLLEEKGMLENRIREIVSEIQNLSQRIAKEKKGEPSAPKK